MREVALERTLAQKPWHVRLRCRDDESAAGDRAQPCGKAATNNRLTGRLQRVHLATMTMSVLDLLVGKVAVTPFERFFV